MKTAKKLLSKFQKNLPQLDKMHLYFLAVFVWAFIGFLGFPRYNQVAAQTVVISTNEIVNEADGTVTFNFDITSTSRDDITVNYSTFEDVADTATDTQDYNSATGNFTVTFGTATYTTIPITIIDDFTPEPNETFSISLRDGNFTFGTWKATIIDNDSPTPTPIPPTATPGPGPTATPGPGPSATPGPGPTSTPGPAPTSTPAPKKPKVPFIPITTIEPTSEPELTPSPEPTATVETPINVEQKPPVRSAFVQSVLDFTQLPFTLKSLLQGLAMSGFLILLILFPAELFNATVQSNYDEIIGWFWIHKLQQYFKKVQQIPHIWLAIIYGILSAFINSLLSPDFGFNKPTFALFIGMFLALVLGTAVYDVVRAYYMKRKLGLESRLRPHSFGVLMGALLVLTSRIAHFLPGYCYGLFTGLVFNKQPKDKDDGKGLALSALMLLGVALAAWFLWVPFKKTMGDNPSLIALILDAAMASLWVSALTATVFGLAPLRFMYGEQVKKWNNFGWVAIYFFGVYLFVYTLLNPAIGIYGKSDKANLFLVLALFLGFGGFSFLFWGYFRYRYLWQGKKK